MRMLQVENGTLQEIKVLAAQTNRSVEGALKMLLDHYHQTHERRFEQTFGRLSGEVYLSGQAHERQFGSGKNFSR